MKKLLNQPSSHSQAILLYLIKILALALIYHLAARLGLKMAYVQINTSPVWPPTGIALAALLLFGYRLWPGITLGVLAGSLFTGADFGVAAGMALGNTLEALAGAYLLRGIVKFQNELNRIRDVIGLGLVSVFSLSHVFLSEGLLASGCLFLASITIDDIRDIPAWEKKI